MVHTHIYIWERENTINAERHFFVLFRKERFTQAHCKILKFLNLLFWIHGTVKNKQLWKLYIVYKHPKS